MKVSDRLLALLEEWEAFKSKVYLDSGGAPTIGIGHKLTPKELSAGAIIIGGIPVEYRNGITYEHALQLKRDDLVRFEKVVNQYVKVELSQNEYDALVSFAYNVGDGAFQRSTLLVVLNAGRKDQVPKQMKRWNKSKGIIIQGLINRRNKEIALWEGKI